MAETDIAPTTLIKLSTISFGIIGDANLDGKTVFFVGKPHCPPHYLSEILTYHEIEFFSSSN